jgi:hypothetical protein
MHLSNSVGCMLCIFDATNGVGKCCSNGVGKMQPTELETILMQTTPLETILMQTTSPTVLLKGFAGHVSFQLRWRCMVDVTNGFGYINHASPTRLISWSEMVGPKSSETVALR